MTLRSVPISRTKIRVGMPFVAVCGFSAYGSLEDIKAAGFDFAEIHLAGSTTAEVAGHMREAAAIGLPCTIHGTWWWNADGAGQILNRILRAMNRLPPYGYKLEDTVIFSEVGGRLAAPLVPYADQAVEAIRLPGEVRIQTYSQRDECGRFILPYGEFIKQNASLRFLHTFDPQHALVYKGNHPGKNATRFLSSDPDRIIDDLESIWDELGGSERIAEIHAVDWDSDRRNVLFGEGLGASLTFIRQKIEDGWTGDLVIEVLDGLPKFMTSLGNLAQLRNDVRNHLGV